MTSSTSSSYDTPFNRLLYAILLLPVINAQVVPILAKGSSYVTYCSNTTVHGLTYPYIHVYEGSSGPFSRGIKDLNTATMILGGAVKTGDELARNTLRDAPVCNNALNGGTVAAPIVRCNDDSKNPYYLTNYVGAASSTKGSTGAYYPQSFNGQAIVKHKIDSNSDLAHAWGYFASAADKEARYDLRDCSKYTDGTAVPSLIPGTPNLAAKYPVGQVAYCSNWANYYVYNGNDQWKQVDKFSIAAYGYSSGGLPTGSSAPGVGCKFNSDGTRAGTCSLPAGSSFVQYIADCSIGSLTRTPTTPTTAVPLVEGIYYKHGNGIYQWNSISATLLPIYSSVYPDSYNYAMQTGKSVYINGANYAKRSIKRGIIAASAVTTHTQSLFRALEYPTPPLLDYTRDCDCKVTTLIGGKCKRQLTGSTAIIPQGCAFSKFMRICGDVSFTKAAFDGDARKLNEDVYGNCDSVKAAWNNAASPFNSELKKCISALPITLNANLNLPASATLACDLLNTASKQAVVQ